MREFSFQPCTGKFLNINSRSAMLSEMFLTTSLVYANNAAWATAFWLWTRREVFIAQMLASVGALILSDSTDPGGMVAPLAISSITWSLSAVEIWVTVSGTVPISDLVRSSIPVGDPSGWNPTGILECRKGCVGRAGVVATGAAVEGPG